MIQSSSNSCSGVANPCHAFFGMNTVPPLSTSNLTYVVQREYSAAFQKVQCFVHSQVPVDRNPSADSHLLGAQGKKYARLRAGASSGQERLPSARIAS